MPTLNQLILLHRLASSQDENFFTESLAYLLSYFVENEPESASRLIMFLGHLNLSDKDVAFVTVGTQVLTPFGVPDLEVRGKDFVILIEAKIESDLGDDQIQRYRKAIKQYNIENQVLVVLTRSQLEFGNEKPDLMLRWFELAECLSTLRPTTEVGKHILKEFIDLMRWRGLTMEAVSWELDHGLRAFQSLLEMLLESLKLNRLNVYQKSAAWDWHGYYIEDKKFFVGVYFSEPTAIWFNTEVDIKEPFPKELKFGEIKDHRWQRKLSLDSEEVHFFARSKASQLRCLEKYIQETAGYARMLVEQGEQ